MVWFLGALASAHGKKAIQGLTDAIVAADPTTATAAQLQMMEQDLDAAGRQLAGLRSAASKDHDELAAVQSRFERMQAASERLLAQYNAEADETKKAALQVSLNGLLTTLENLKAELAQDQKNAADSDAMVLETEKIYQEKAESLKNAKATLAEAAHNLERANIEKQHADMQAEQAAQIAGLRNNDSGGLNAAVNALQRQADKAHQDAEAKRMKASVLSQVEAGGMDDPNVKAALAAVSGTSNQSFEERIAALKH